MDLTRRTKEDGDAPSRDFEVEVVPVIKGFTQQPPWTIRGHVKRAFTFSPPWLDFEERLLRGKPFKSQATVVTCDTDVEDLTATSNVSFLKLHVTRVGRKPDLFRLEISPQPDIPGGPFDAEVKLSGRSSAEELIPGSLQVWGRVLEEFYTLPESLALGTRTLGERVNETVVLQSRTGKHFKVTGIKPPSQDITVRAEQGNTRGQPLTINVNVSRLGAQKSDLSVFVVNEETLEPLEIRLPISYHGIPGGKENHREPAPSG
jgi:hypothetical protein